jgi:signal transduction histidine kinase/ActR/RegA family two-component response regulator
VFGLGHLLVSPWILVILAAVMLNLIVAGLALGVSSAPGWRDQRGLVFLALSCASYSFFDMHTCVAPLPEALRLAASSLVLASAACMIAAWLLYAAAVRGRPLDRLERLATAANLLAAFVALVPGAAWTHQVKPREVRFLGLKFWDLVPNQLGNLCLVVISLGLLVAGANQLRDVRRGLPYSKYMALAIGLCGAAGVHDMLVSNVVFTSVYLGELGFLAGMVTLAVGLSRRFMASASELEALTQRLEARVAERTRELEVTHEALAKAERLGAVGQLAAGVAHEINNPASAIAANLDYLSRSLGRLSDPEAGAAMSDASASIRRITRIVRQLLDASRVAAQGMRPEATAPLAEVVKASVEAARATIVGEAKVELDVQPLHVRAERYFLEQVITNLIANAAQSVPAGREPRISVRTEVALDGVSLEIEDNGAGMSEAVLRRIGEPFFSTKPVGQGTGLGLAVSFGLVKAMGGSLRFESEPGLGTKARLELRVAAVPNVDRTSSRIKTSPAATRVLLVDDDGIVLRSLARSLRSSFQVTAAESVREAEDHIERKTFDVIVCDVMMPDGGAIALYAWLEKHHPALLGRTIFLTGGASSSESREFLNARQQPVLKKPFALRELDDLVSEILGEQQASGRP